MKIAEPRFRVVSATKVKDGCDEWVGALKDGRKIRAIISGGVLEVDVANPIVDPEKGRRFYRQHRGKMRTVLVKVIEPDNYEKNRLSYEDLKANTVGYIEWPAEEAAIVVE